MKLAVIIPSGSVKNLEPCLAAVRLHEPDMPVVVVSDGLELGAVAAMRYPGVMVAPGVKPFVFARNVNIGIRAADELCAPEGIILLNDDALLKTPGGFTMLGLEAEARPEYGIISAVTNSAGNPNQYSRGSGFRDEPRVLCFVCVLITAAALHCTGPLDERFDAYGWEDNDLCRRAREYGLRLGVSESCFVDHLSLKSTFRGDPRAGGDISKGAAIYRAKWGDLA
jgi:GT2 family glycosyltransferase